MHAAAATTPGFGALNSAVLVAYLAAMIWIGWRFAGRQKTAEDFFLAGRRLPWLAVAMSMYASVTSAVTYIGVPGMAYRENVSLIVVSLMSPVVAPLLIFLFYPFYRRWRMTTSYEYAALRFGRGARFAVAALFLLARLGWLGLVIYAPALTLALATGLPLALSIVLMGVLATAYTVMGGLSAVVWTDVVQFLIMIGGAVWIAVALAGSAPGGVSEILEFARTTGHLKLADWTFDPHAMNSLAVAVAYFFLLQQDYGVDQVTVQRLLAVRTSRGVARAIVFNACTDFLIIGLLLFAGLGLHYFYTVAPHALPQGLPGDAVLPWFVMRELPAGISGLVITAVFAAAMSSMDSGINSLATVAIRDLAEPIRGRPYADADSVRLARWLTLALGIFATVAAFGVARIGGMVRAFYAFMGVFSAPVLALFLLGMLTRRAGARGWMVGAAVSLAATLAVRHAGLCHEIWLFPFSFLTTFVVGYAASWILRDAPPAPGLTVWDRSRAPRPAEEG